MTASTPGYGNATITATVGAEASVTTDINADDTFVDYGYELEARQSMGFLGGIGKHFYLYGSFFQGFEEAGEIPEEQVGEVNIVESDQTKLNASGGINFSYKRLELRVNATWQNKRVADEDDAIRDAIIWPDARVGNPGWFTPDPTDDSDTPYAYTAELIQPEDLRIDISGSFRLTDHFTLDWSARNITKSYPLPYYELSDGSQLPYYGQIHNQSQKQIYGVNFTIGLSATF